MKRNLMFIPWRIIAVTFIVWAIVSCKKEKVPAVSTTEVTDITQNTAMCGGSVTSNGGAPVIARGVVWSTHHNPTIDDSKTIDGAGTGSFVSSLTELEAETEYYVRAYAINGVGTAYGNAISFYTSGGQLTDKFTDERDGTVYKTITIGNQVWMAENLRYLPSVVPPGTSSNSTPCFYVYDYNGTIVEEAKGSPLYSIYGVLYNWAASMNGESSSSTNPSGVQGICPVGWHLPSDAEWDQLVNYLGGENVAGGIMKENTDLYWISPNTGATNQSGFTALPGGYKYTDGKFHHLGYYATWWSATSGNNGAFDRYIVNDNAKIYRSESNSSGGWSIRCIQN